MTNEEAIWTLKEAVDEAFGAGIEIITRDGCEAIEMAIEALEERKTGKWELDQNPIDWGWDINCSVCKNGENGFFANGRENAEFKLKHQYLMDKKQKKSMRYCPFCGAKMEVDE